MKLFKTFFLLTPFFATAQVNNSVANKCQETNYQFFRQGLQEEQSSKTYDIQGNLLKKIDTFSRRNTEGYTDEYAYDYDANGKNTTVTYKQNGQIKTVTKKIYNAAGNLISESSSVDGKTSPLASLTSNNGESIQVFYDQDGVTELSKEKKTFDKSGQLTKKEISNASGKLMMSETRSYNLQGNILQNINFDATDKVTLQTDYEYDAKGNLLKDKTLRNNILFAETNNEHD